MAAVEGFFHLVDPQDARGEIFGEFEGERHGLFRVADIFSESRAEVEAYEVDVEGIAYVFGHH